MKWLIVALAVGVAGWGLYLWIRPGEVIGSSESAGGVPLVGAEMRPLNGRQFKFITRRGFLANGHGWSVVVSGVTDWESVKTFAEQHQLDLMSAYSRDPSLRHKLTEYRGRQEGICVDFSSDDAFAMGKSGRLEHVEFHFRHSDGRFTMIAAGSQ